MDSLDKSTRDRSVLDWEKFAQAVEGGLNCVPQGEKCVQHWFELQRLSWAESYLSGRLKFVLRYRDVALNGDVAAVVTARTKPLKGRLNATARIDEHRCVGEVVSGGGQDALVLVSDVETVEIVETMLAAREGLNFVSDEVDDVCARPISGFYVSLNGTLLRIPIFCEGEAREIKGGMPIGFDEDAVSVVKGGPEVVQRVSEHCGEVLRNWGASDGNTLFQRALLILDGESFNVLRDETAQHRFKLIDVLLGPFYLQERPIKVQ